MTTTSSSSSRSSPGATVRIELQAVQASGLAAIAEVLPHIPDADTLASGTRVELANASSGTLARLLRRRVSVPTSVRASALLARGYVAIEAGDETSRDAGLVWGLTSVSRPSPGS